MKKPLKIKKIWIAFSIIFLSGIIIGALGGLFLSKKFASQNERRWRQGRVKIHLLRRMSDELQLSEDQKLSVEKILGDMTKNINDIHAKQRPVIKDIIDDSFAAIDQVLNDEQKVKFAEMQQRMAKFREKHRYDRERRNRGGHERRQYDGAPLPPEKHLEFEKGQRLPGVQKRGGRNRADRRPNQRDSERGENPSPPLSDNEPDFPPPPAGPQ